MWAFGLALFAIGFVLLRRRPKLTWIVATLLILTGPAAVLRVLAQMSVVMAMLGGESAPEIQLALASAFGMVRTEFWLSSCLVVLGTIGAAVLVFLRRKKPQTVSA